VTDVAAPGLGRELPLPAVMTVEGCICLPLAAQSGDLAGAAVSEIMKKLINEIKKTIHV
jgi:hypothetical protein